MVVLTPHCFSAICPRDTFANAAARYPPFSDSLSGPLDEFSPPLLKLSMLTWHLFLQAKIGSSKEACNNKGQLLVRKPLNPYDVEPACNVLWLSTVRPSLPFPRSFLIMLDHSLSCFSNFPSLRTGANLPTTRIVGRTKDNASCRPSPPKLQAASGSV